MQDDGYTVVQVGTAQYGAYYHYVLMDENGVSRLDMHFQNGPVREVGRNGFTEDEVLLMVMNRLMEFQNGLACEENEIAIEAIKQARDALHARTLRREKEGTEGTMTETAGAVPAKKVTCKITLDEKDSCDNPCRGNGCPLAKE